MDAARLNFSHGDRRDHVTRIRLIRQASQRTGKPIAVIQDLQGPSSVSGTCRMTEFS